jgi:tyrosyl-tRNA synthetase
MSKSIGNYIGITEPPEVMYGKVMSLPDEAMLNYFNLVTRWTPDKITGIEVALKAEEMHPMAAKKQLASEIVDIFYGETAAVDAAAHLPQEIPTYTLSDPLRLSDVMHAAQLAPSKSQARRLIQQHGVRLDDEVVTDVTAIVEPGEHILQVGKRRFLRLLSQVR